MIKADARDLPVRAGSVACIVSSPPYNTAAAYAEYDDAQPWEKYWDMAYDACAEMYRVLQPSGRLWLNVQHVVPAVPRARDRKLNVQGHGREDRVNLLQGWSCAAEDVGFKYRDTVAWVQDAHDGQAAWGSWLRPSAPNMRGGWEAVLVLYKDAWRRTRPDYVDPAYKAPQWLQYEPCACQTSGIVLDQCSTCHGTGVVGAYEGSWMALVRNVWTIRTRRDASHVAVFPDELARRCILLSTWPGEVVLDPFAGSGTTERVANTLGRVGVNVERHYQLR